MNKKILLIFVVLQFFAFVAIAKDVRSVRTSGKGTITERDYYIFYVNETEYQAVFPNKITTGSSIKVKYMKDDKIYLRNFYVETISQKGDTCHIHNDGSEYDTITVSPCVKSK